MKEKPQHIETISILGCGWLGLPLGEYLKQKSYKIKGSTISIEKLGLLKKKGIEPFLINLNPTLQGKDIDQFFECLIYIKLFSRRMAISTGIKDITPEIVLYYFFNY